MPFQEKIKDIEFLKTVSSGKNTVTEIKTALGLSDNTTKRRMKKLSEIGFIKAEQKDFGSSFGYMYVYELTAKGKREIRKNESENEIKN